MAVGGVESTIIVKPVKWVEAPVYKESELLEPPVIFPTPTSLRPASSEEERDEPSDEEEVLIPGKVLAELCRGRDFASLPTQIQDYLLSSAGTAADNRVADIGGGSGEEQQDLQMATIRLATDDHNMETDNDIIGFQEPDHVASQSTMEVRLATPTQSQTIPDDSYPLQAQIPEVQPAQKTTLENLPPHTTALQTTDEGDKSTQLALLEKPTVTTSPQGFRTLQGLRSAVKQKRKAAHNSKVEEQHKKPNRVGQDKQGEGTSILGQEETTKAEPVLLPDGFYQIRVEYGHCVDLTNICEVKPKEVLQTVEEDNRERRADFQTGEAQKGKARVD